MTRPYQQLELPEVYHYLLGVLDQMPRRDSHLMASWSEWLLQKNLSDHRLSM